MALLVPNTLNRILDANGNPVSGGKAKFYITETLTLATVYADAARQTPLTNPVEADGGGLLPNVYLGTGTYRLITTNAADQTISDTDPFTPFLTGDDITYIPDGSGAESEPIQDALRRIGAFPEQYGAVGNGSTDDTAAIQAALTANKHVILRSTSGYKITAALTLVDGQTVDLAPGVTIRQYTAGTPAFTATSKTNVWINLNGGTIYGSGGYSQAWINNSGQPGYRGVRFLGCTYSGITGPGKIVNWGSAGVEILGGSNVSVTGRISIIGTNAYGGTILDGGNFQQGVYISNHASYGGASDILLAGLEISNVAQGVLIEAQVGVAGPTGTRMLADIDFHDIVGQHCVYNQDSYLSVSNCSGLRVGGSVIKTQSADANRDLTGIVAIGITGEDVGVSLFEMAVVGTGSLSQVMLSGVGKDVGYGLSLNGEILGLQANIVISGAGTGLYAFGDGMRDIRVHVDVENAEEDGVLVTAAGASQLDIWANVRNANLSGTAGQAGIRIATASATVTLHNPTVVHSGATMPHALFHSVLGADVRIRGYPTLTGATDYAVRATGLITSFPGNFTVSGTVGRFEGTATITFLGPTPLSNRSTSGSNVVVASAPLADGYHVVRAVLAGRKSDLSERKSVFLQRGFTATAGMVTAGDATVDTPIDDSASFGGAYSLIAGTGVTGDNTFVIVANGATYDWTARFEVISL